MLKHLPNFFTLLNLLAGFFSLIAVLNSKYILACNFIILGAFLDAVDGLTAFVSKKGSPLGAQLDSLSDLTTFGIAPSVLTYALIQDSSPGIYTPYLYAVLTIYIIAGSLRLAIFNSRLISQPSKKERGNYLGLPITVAGLVIPSYLLFANRILDGIPYPLLLLVILPILSVFMLSTICFRKIDNLPLFSLISKTPILFILILVLIVFSLIYFKMSALLFPFLVLYILNETIRALFKGKNNESRHN